MLRRHELEKVRTYLLGALGEDHAAQLEQRYFADPKFFEEVWSIEEELIAKYLRGRLSPADREKFEARYLQIPALRKRLDEVRASLTATRRPVLWRWAAAGAAALCMAVLLGWWVLERHSPAPVEVSKEAPAVQVALLDVHLTPGLIKGDAARQSEFAPPSGGKVRISFELPGKTASVQCQVTLSIIGADGRGDRVWTSPSTVSEPADG